MRGEYSSAPERRNIRTELPPRARRIPISPYHRMVWTGTTSACAENTSTLWRSMSKRRNYLRVRGEYVTGEGYALADRELPPRARRIHLPGNERQVGMGTTSACAENTPSSLHQSASSGNYLRVRGEYPTRSGGTFQNWELPPRARRIPFAGVGGFKGGGTTSACAENTFEAFNDWGDKGNYLRVRGEYWLPARDNLGQMELPPRARRIRKFTATLSVTARNYLRVRGEYPLGGLISRNSPELPPRARRIRITH